MAGSFVNTFESIPNGQQISTSNSAGTDDSVAITGKNVDAGNTVTLDGSTTHAAHGTTSLKVATAGTSWTSYAFWTLDAGVTYYARLYLYMTANPAASRKVLQFNNAAGTVNCGGVSITSSGHISTHAGASAISTTSGSIALNQWVRIECRLTSNASTGSVEFKYWANSDSTGTPDLANASAASYNTGAGDCGRVIIGSQIAAANVGAYWIDEVGASSIDWMGPAVIPGVPESGTASDSLVVAAAVRCEDSAAVGISCSIFIGSAVDSATVVDACSVVGNAQLLAAGIGSDRSTIGVAVTLRDSGAATTGVIRNRVLASAGSAQDALSRTIIGVRCTLQDSGAASVGLTAVASGDYPYIPIPTTVAITADVGTVTISGSPAGRVLFNRHYHGYDGGYSGSYLSGFRELTLR